MNKLGQPNAEVKKENVPPEEMLIALNVLIESYTSKVVHNNCKNLSRDARDQLKQEVAQNTRIKIWAALQVRKIEHLKAYIMSTVYHELITIVRQKQKLGAFHFFA